MKEGRCNFNPCEFNQLLYLCGHPSSIIEALDPVQCSFLPFQARLPESYSFCLLLVHNEQLLVVSENYVSVWTYEQERLVQVSLLEHYKLEVCSNMNPVCDMRSSYFYVSSGGKCLKVKLDCTEWKELGTID
jgi:hypothetical protein